MSLEEDYASYKESCLLFDKNPFKSVDIGNFSFILGLNYKTLAIINFGEFGVTDIPDDCIDDLNHYDIMKLTLDEFSEIHFQLVLMDNKR